MHAPAPPPRKVKQKVANKRQQNKMEETAQVFQLHRFHTGEMWFILWQLGQINEVQGFPIVCPVTWQVQHTSTYTGTKPTWVLKNWAPFRVVGQES